MAQLISYASSTECRLLGRKGWHRKYMILAIAIILFGMAELGLRGTTWGVAPFDDEANPRTLRQGIAVLYSHNPVLADPDVLYRGILTVCGGLLALLVIRVLRVTGFRLCQLDAAERMRFWRISVMLCLAIIVAAAGMMTPPAPHRARWFTRWYTNGSIM